MSQPKFGRPENTLYYFIEKYVMDTDFREAIRKNKGAVDIGNLPSIFTILQREAHCYWFELTSSETENIHKEFKNYMAEIAVADLDDSKSNSSFRNKVSECKRQERDGKLGVSEDLFRLSGVKWQRGDIADLRRSMFVVAGSSAPITLAADAKEFVNNLAHFTDNGLRGFNLKHSGLVVAGGAVERCLRGKSSDGASDLDVFSCDGADEKRIFEKAKILFDCIVKNLTEDRKTLDQKNGHASAEFTFTAYRTQGCVSLLSRRLCKQKDGRVIPLCGRLVQVILRPYKNVSELLHDFDLGSSAVAWDGSEVWFSSMGRLAYEYGVNVVSLANRRPSYERRLVKYFDRGFDVAIPMMPVEFKPDRCYVRVDDNSGAEDSGGYGTLHMKHMTIEFKERLPRSVKVPHDADHDAGLSTDDEVGSDASSGRVDYVNEVDFAINNIAAFRTATEQLGGPKSCGTHEGRPYRAYCGSAPYGPDCRLEDIRPTAMARPLDLIRILSGNSVKKVKSELQRFIPENSAAQVLGAYIAASDAVKEQIVTGLMAILHRRYAPHLAFQPFAALKRDADERTLTVIGWMGKAAFDEVFVKK